MTCVSAGIGTRHRSAVHRGEPGDRRYLEFARRKITHAVAQLSTRKAPVLAALVVTMVGLTTATATATDAAPANAVHSGMVARASDPKPAGVEGSPNRVKHLTGTVTAVPDNGGPQPQSATKCISGVVCQYLVGSGLLVKSWKANAWSDQFDGTVCDAVQTFVYNVGGGNNVWAVVSFPGCYTAAPGTRLEWASPETGPVRFAGNTNVNVQMAPFGTFGTTPTANVHS